MDRARRYLERTRQRTAPSIERHGQALATQGDAHDHLRSCDIADRLDALLPSADEQRQRVVALTTWRRWAEGAPVPINELRDAFDRLAIGRGREHIQIEQLAERLQRWATHHDIAICECADPVRVGRTPQLGLGL